MPNLELKPLRYDPRCVYAASDALTNEDLDELYPALDGARANMLHHVDLWDRNRREQAPLDVPLAWLPLDAGFVDLPQRLLEEYRRHESASELGKILAAARAMAAEVDRVVVLGIGGSYMGARAMFEACCHPYWNELHRGERAGHPRLYFEGNNLDNDAMQGLLDLLVRSHGLPSDHNRWGLVVISKGGDTLETAAALRVFLHALREHNGGQLNHNHAPLAIPITGRGSNLHKMMTAFGVRDEHVFEVPEGVGGRFSIFSAVGLLPAAILGLDVVKLLEGAGAMNHHFRMADPTENLVLQYVAACHLAEQHLGATIRLLASWGKSLEALGLWYDQLLSESLGKKGAGATPLTIVNTRDLHSRGQQHQSGRRDKLITNLLIDSPRRDRVAIPAHADAQNQDNLNRLSAKSRTIPECLHIAAESTNQAYAEEGRPTADLFIPRCDEPALGQLFQLLMLATVVEGHLLNINPYGQPGVEAYKGHMRKRL